MRHETAPEAQGAARATADAKNNARAHAPAKELTVPELYAKLASEHLLERVRPLGFGAGRLFFHSTATGQVHALTPAMLMRAPGPVELEPDLPFWHDWAGLIRGRLLQPDEKVEWNAIGCRLVAAAYRAGPYSPPGTVMMRKPGRPRLPRDAEGNVVGRAAAGAAGEGAETVKLGGRESGI